MYKTIKLSFFKNIKNKKTKFNPEKLCKYKNPPKCLRYMKTKDCNTQLSNPDGPDCNAGVDFCSNLNIDVLPDVVIPESKYIYKKNIDIPKVKEYFKNKGKKNLTPAALNMYMRRDEDFDKSKFEKTELYWPILEN